VTKQGGSAANSGRLEPILSDKKSIGGPSLGNMLAPKHKVPLSTQDIAANQLSPQYQQYQEQAPTNYFVQQMTAYFQQHNLTDGVGNFRPGELQLPAYKNFLSPQSDDHVGTLTSQNKDITESSSPQDSDYVTAFTNEADDLTRTGFMESNNDDDDNKRPGTEQTSYTSPGTYWYPYTAVPPFAGTTERGVIASPNEQLYKLQSVHSPIDTSSFIDTSASLIDEHGTEDFQPGTRPGNNENQEPSSEITDLRYKMSSYPSPRKFGLNYFKDQKIEEETRERERQQIEQQKQLKKKQNMMYYPNPIPLKSKNGSVMRTFDPVALAKAKQQKALVEAMKVKVKVEQNKNGMSFIFAFYFFKGACIKKFPRFFDRRKSSL